MSAAIKRKIGEVEFTVQKRQRNETSRTEHTAQAISGYVNAKLQEYTQAESFFLMYPGGRPNFAFDVQLLALMQIIDYTPDSTKRGVDIFGEATKLHKVNLTKSLIETTASTSLACYLKCTSHSSEFRKAALNFIDVQIIMGIVDKIPQTFDQRSRITHELYAAELLREETNPLPAARSISARQVNTFISDQFRLIYESAYANAIGKLVKSSQELGEFFFSEENSFFWSTDLGLTKELSHIIYEYTFDPFEGCMYSKYLADIRFYSQKMITPSKLEAAKRIFVGEYEQRSQALINNFNDVMNFNIQMLMVILMANPHLLPLRNERWTLGIHENSFRTWQQPDINKMVKAATFMVQNPEFPRDFPNWLLLYR